MSVAFVTRPPAENEIEQIRLAMSTFCDGSGMIMQSDGGTLPGWRDFERLLAAILGGFAPEGKDVFDIIVPSSDRKNVDYGISVKSKELSRRSAIADLEADGRVYMELANSPAKFFAALHAVGLNEDDFRNNRHEAKFGTTVLEVVEGWHFESVKSHESRFPGRTLDLEKSIHLVVSYSKPRPGELREYQLHAFDLSFPKDLTWSHKSEKCLRAEEPRLAGETLIDWYALSGGQLKYYPRAQDARYESPRFTLEHIPRMQSVQEKAARYWPEEWISAGGQREISNDQIVQELRSLALLVNDSESSDYLTNAAEKIDKRQDFTKE